MLIEIKTSLIYLQKITKKINIKIENVLIVYIHSFFNYFFFIPLKLRFTYLGNDALFFSMLFYFF